MNASFEQYSSIRITNQFANNTMVTVFRGEKMLKHIQINKKKNFKLIKETGIKILYVRH